MSLFSDLLSRSASAHQKTMGEAVVFIPAVGEQREITAVPLLRNGRFADGQLHRTSETELQLTAMKSATDGFDILGQGDAVRWQSAIWTFRRLSSDDGATIVAVFQLTEFIQSGKRPSQL